MGVQLQLPLQLVEDGVYYPETDGKPMAESDLHRDAMFYVIRLLQDYFAGQQVYVSGNLLIYYEKGNRYKSVAPDCFIVWDIEPKRRRSYRLWQEGKAPAVVFEVTSKGTQSEDLGKKMRLCAQLGVQEYYLYDPTGEYLEPPLAAFELSGGGYVPMQPVKDIVTVGDLTFTPGEGETPEYISPLLGLRLALDEQRQLCFYDPTTGRRLLTDAEERVRAEQAQRDAEQAAAEERQRAEEAQRRADEAEAENVRLRAALARWEK
jgi:Uma2 family endonuclease